MTPFDPIAATQAFLAVAPAAARLRAIHYTQGGHWLLLWGWLASLVACYLIARSGVLPAISKRLQAKRPRPRLLAFAAGVVFMVMDFAIELPWNSYADWWREMTYGLTSQAFAGWLGEQLLMTLISAIVYGLLSLGLYALMRRAPRRWWLWGALMVSGGFILIMIIAPILIEPLFNHYTPAPPGLTRDAVVALAKTAGIPSDKIFVYDGSRQSNRYTANVSGAFGSARVAMSDVMAAKGADIAEVRGVIGHEMGHYVHGHIFIIAAIYGVLALVAFGVTQRIFPLVDRWLKTGAKDVADPVGLPSLMIIVTCLFLLALPVTNTATRFYEADADAFSLALAHEPAGLAKALVKTLEYRADSPGAVEEFLFYDHPSVHRRVQSAMDWKARHLTVAQAQEAADGAMSRPPLRPGG